MKNVLSGIGIALLVAATAACAQGASSADSSAGGGGHIDYTKITPLQLVKQTPKGQLHNPYKDTDKKIVAEGHEQFMGHGCNGCHGGGGGGGMCPPLINGVWIYGGSDDTLFRLVTLGSINLQKQGYVRRGMENVVAPMPEFGPLIQNANELWEIITWVRSAYGGPKGYKYGGPSLTPPPGGN